ncbi:MAG: NUDIX hydrolase [Deferribacteres bacterium]|nr:NUDIX hydrolase [candidate division KSB1 bacterium]MCB9503687.1 NUDIX hydrolase [Deferribacteres bacterium]
MNLKNKWDAIVHHRGEFLEFLEYKSKEYIHNVRATGIVLVIPVTAEKEIIFIEQYRIVMHNYVIEYPAGLAGDEASLKDEALEDAAKRELFEEAGYETDELLYLMAAPTSPGTSTEVVNYYLALNCRQTGSGGGDETETIIVHKVPLHATYDWLQDKLKDGLLVDPRVYTGLYFVDHYLR